MNKIIKIIFVLLAIGGIVAGWFWYQNNFKQEKNLAVVYTISGNGESKFDDLMDNKLSDIGFTVTDPHKRINDSYKKHFGSTKLDLISFMPTVNVEKMEALFVKEPRLALYSPFNMLIFKKTGENKTQLMHLTPEAILDIAGITDEGVKTEFIAIFKPLDERIEKVFGGKKSYITYNTLDDDRIMNFEVTFKRPEKISDFVEQFQEKFEEKFEENKYIIAGYYDYKTNLTDGPAPLPEYDAFWIYSLCHLEFSYNIFDTEGLRPDAGIFAPCTMYMYIKKGSNKLVIGMPKLKNWATTLKITDKKRADMFVRLDAEMPKIMMALGAVSIGEGSSAVLEEGEASSDAAASNAAQNGAKFDKPDANAGNEIDGKIPAYLRAKYQTPDEVVASLKSAGFTHIATDNINSDQSVIIFTNNAIAGLAAKPSRGFAANLRVMADKTNNQLTITNPLYLQSAFLQEGYNKNAAQQILDSLKKAFPNSINSDDKLGVGNIGDYNFMVSMPYYEDMITVGTGTNEELLAKLKAKKVVAFEQKLVNGSTLVGIKLSNRTTKFASKIGSQNAIALPYTVLIENNKAYILHPKYYIALMYPLLDMGTFMTIATVPGAIENEIKGIF